MIVAAVIEKDGKILLGRKPDGVGPYPDMWHLPGGGVSLGEESLIDAIKREIKEETGLEPVEIERIGFDEDFEPDKHGEMTHYVFLVYKVEPASTNAVASDDVVKLQWFDKSELQNLPLTTPSQKLFSKMGLL